MSNDRGTIIFWYRLSTTKQISVTNILFLKRVRWTQTDPDRPRRTQTIKIVLGRSNQTRVNSDELRWCWTDPIKTDGPGLTKISRDWNRRYPKCRINRPNTIIHCLPRSSFVFQIHYFSKLSWLFASYFTSWAWAWRIGLVICMGIS